MLLYIGKNFTCRNIVEFGGGFFSTSVFPNVESVITYEAKSSWLNRMRSEITDNRWKSVLIKVKKSGNLGVPRPSGDIDLLLVDGENSQRLRSIKLWHFAANVIVVHDVEYTKVPTEIYLKKKYGKKYCRYTPPYKKTPCTGIVCKNKKINIKDIKWVDYSKYAERI